ncbi:hypothetical protein M758_6G200700 [Ceratodon purpureus]|nr:hypothetical protein M758_7G026100 [Ceratodon purpureus]KAG0614746.1 hypothetical protein M758_6G200700 [Ceratodon purpureus]
MSCHERVRFAILASSWFPRPLGILLWVMVHVLLVVVGSVLALAMFVAGVVIGLPLVVLVFFMCMLPFLWIGLGKLMRCPVSDHEHTGPALCVCGVFSLCGYVGVAAYFEWIWRRFCRDLLPRWVREIVYVREAIYV